MRDLFIKHDLYKVSRALGAKFGVDMQEQISEGYSQLCKLRGFDGRVCALADKKGVGRWSALG